MVFSTQISMENEKQKSTVRIHHNIGDSSNNAESSADAALMKTKYGSDNTNSLKTLKIQESAPDSIFAVAKALNNQPLSLKDQSIQHESGYASNKSVSVRGDEHKNNGDGENKE